MTLAQEPFNGAEALVRTLWRGGIDVCFANPGTSEMHFVAALDRHPEIRCVLGLFEGVVSGAADGYARMAGRPAASLLHLAPGLGNALANLHNARKARTPMLTVVGDHAGFHLRHESPLKGDVAGTAATVSDWVRFARRPDEVSALTAEAIAVASRRPGRSATLVLPADAAWDPAPPAIHDVKPLPAPPLPPGAALQQAVRALREGASTLLYLGGAALREANAERAGCIAAKTGCGLLSQLYTPRVERGAGRVAIDRLPYPPEPARRRLAPYRAIVLLGAPPPVSFFGYPGQPSELQAPGATLVDLGCDIDIDGTLRALVDALGAAACEPVRAPRQAVELPPAGRLTARAVNQALGALMPEAAVLIDEAVSSADGLLEFSRGAPPHDLLRLTGGAIGIGVPLALGAAIGAPGRRVIAMQADGSAMYTLQGLWTQARERLDVVTVIYSNRRYAILQGELKGVGAGVAGANARRMMDLDDPALDWVKLANGMGVEATRADDAAAFADTLKAALARRGPFLIEARI